MSGNGPPSKTAPSLLVAALLQKPRPSKVINFGEFVKAAVGTQFEKVRVVVPPARAHGEAQLAAHNRLRDEVKLPPDQWESEVGKSILSDLVAKEMIAKTLHSVEEIAPGKWARLLTDSKDVDAIFSSEEVAVLFDLWLGVQRELGPRLSVLTPKEADSWVEVLKDGMDPIWRLGYLDVATLAFGLAQQLHQLRQSSSESDQPSSPPSTSPDSWESSLPSYATDTSSFGEPQSPLPEFSTDLLSEEEAAAIAARMARGEF